MARREQVFHQFLRPLKGIGLPVNYNVTDLPKYESEIAFDRNKSKFLFSIEENEGQEDFKWVTVSRAREVVTVTEDYTMDSDDYVVLANATPNAITITLSDATESKDNEVHIKRLNAADNTVTIATQNNQTIDGAPSITINKQYITMSLICDGTQWFII